MIKIAGIGPKSNVQNRFLRPVGQLESNEINLIGSI